MVEPVSLAFGLLTLNQVLFLQNFNLGWGACNRSKLVDARIQPDKPIPQVDSQSLNWNRSKIKTSLTTFVNAAPKR